MQIDLAKYDASELVELLLHKNLLSQLDGLLSVLDERECRIIHARYGLNGEDPKTLEEVGQEFGITRERIRQLQNIALKKLRRALKKRGVRHEVLNAKFHEKEAPITDYGGLRQAEIVELRFFAGMTVAEVADYLGVSKRTVESDWTAARTWLARVWSARTAMAKAFDVPECRGMKSL